MYNQVIWKNRVLNPNKISTISRNKTYLDYICLKENVLRNEFTEHGLWGHIRDIPNIEKNNSLSEVHKYINKIGNEKKNIYRGIISFDERDAIEKGFTEKEKWEELIKVKLPEFAKKINIKSENLEYVASVHLDKGHPHLHILYWDREQEIQKNFIHKKLSDNFRISLNKYIFNEEYTEALKQRDSIKEKFTDFEKDIEKQLLNEMVGKNTDIKISSNKDFIYGETIFLDRIDRKELKDIVNQLLELRQELKKTEGRLNYQFLKKYPEIIEKIDSISKNILESSPSLKKEFYKYIDKSVKIAEITKTTNPESLKIVEKKAEEDLLKQIGNKVLNVEKAFIHQEELNAEEKIQFENNLLQGISEMVCLFSQLNMSNDYNLKNINKNKDLTKEARIEIAKKMQDKSSLEW